MKKMGAKGNVYEMDRVWKRQRDRERQTETVTKTETESEKLNFSFFKNSSKLFHLTQSKTNSTESRNIVSIKHTLTHKIIFDCYVSWDMNSRTHKYDHVCGVRVPNGNHKHEEKCQLVLQSIISVGWRKEGEKDKEREGMRDQKTEDNTEILFKCNVNTWRIQQTIF